MKSLLARKRRWLTRDVLCFACHQPTRKGLVHATMAVGWCDLCLARWPWREPTLREFLAVSTQAFRADQQEAV